jgi:uncharacterized protein
VDYHGVISACSHTGLETFDYLVIFMAKTPCMNRSVVTACTLFLLFFITEAGWAQSKPAAEIAITFDTTSVPQDELTASIIDLLKMTGAINLGKQFAENLSNIRKSGNSSQLPPDFYDRLMKEYESPQTTKWMINAIVRVYRDKFTLAEIKSIIAFYETPTGKKTISLLPQVMQECMKEGEQIGRYLGMKVYSDLVKEGKVQ